MDAARLAGQGNSSADGGGDGSGNSSSGGGADLYGPPRGVAAIADAPCLAASIICRVLGEAQAGKSGSCAGASIASGVMHHLDGTLLRNLTSLAFPLFTGLSYMGHSLVEALKADRAVRAACFATLPPATALRVAEAGARLFSAASPLFAALARVEPVRPI